MERSLLHSLSLFLRSPSRFFEEHEPATTLPVAIGIVVTFAIALVLSIYFIASILGGTIDGTVAVDNPNRPPEWVCDGPAGEMHETSNCDEPETIERDGGSLVYEAATDYVGYVAVLPFVMWLVGGLVLFAAGRLANGSPSLGGTFALAGWAAVPEFARLTAGLLAIAYALSDETITQLEQAPNVIETALGPVEPVLAVATIATVVWQWALLTGGLQQDADLSRAAAGVAVGIPLSIVLLLSLA
ncbi:hypothetical protein C483_11658 [Natrialba hulunbeirensis JCM 10989]|uniref:Yip1 domain-containing protein n=1 Tax=Natrialba hulunbeirensis JCM 10989 TaxID=1227493 RepID=L9ZV09_9EURY|nr:Yip1 family protein [Natrialba hulunbeirensis]ELY90164.1 hypothetical protein C483_11658 [Natrialba hulunbeirensis JCM 10989]